MAQGIWFVSHFFARCASQKTHEHARIARVSRAILARVQFSHVTAAALFFPVSVVDLQYYFVWRFLFKNTTLDVPFSLIDEYSIVSSLYLLWHPGPASSWLRQPLWYPDLCCTGYNSWLYTATQSLQTYEGQDQASSKSIGHNQASKNSAVLWRMLQALDCRSVCCCQVCTQCRQTGFASSFLHCLDTWHCDPALSLLNLFGISKDKCFCFACFHGLRNVQPQP